MFGDILRLGLIPHYTLLLRIISPEAHYCLVSFVPKHAEKLICFSDDLTLNFIILTLVTTKKGL